MLIRKTTTSGLPQVNGIAGFPAPFVVGSARSGTTLLRLMLDAHPDLAIPNETRFIPSIVDQCRTATDSRATFVSNLASRPEWPVFQISEVDLAQRLARVEPFDVGEGLRVFYGLYAARFGKPRWGDKTPIYLESMGLIQDVLPEARFIHLIRDGRDVTLSVKDITHSTVAIDVSANRWLAKLSVARAQVDDLRNYLEIRYEDLVLEPDITLRAVADFIDLPWAPEMLRYHEQSTERMAELELVVRHRADGAIHNWRDIHGLTTRPPQRDRVDVWRREMSVADQERFSELAGDALREFGYPLT